MSKVEVNQVTQQCGTTLTVGGGACKTAVVDATTVTLGRCGGTVSLASGATQSGFGRTGTVDWITTPKVTGDSPITGVTGKGYFLNTTAGAITINLPAGAAGSIVSMADYAATWQTNNVTVTPNGSEKIGGAAGSVTLNTEGQSVTFVYIDSTQGWINTMDSTSNVRASEFMSSTVSGSCNTLATCGDYKIATFKGPGTFCVTAGQPANNVASYLVVAGGAGGSLGGGGAGGFREGKNPADPYAPNASPLAAACSQLSVSGGPHTITVGGGGAAVPNPPAAVQGNTGSNSIFSSITSAGGGGGGGYQAPAPSPTITHGEDGGSGGGGGAWNNPSNTEPGGAGDTPNVTPDQGFDGGNGSYEVGSHTAGGGGGGAGAVGVASPSAGSPGTGVGGAGGAGVTTSIDGTPTARAGGGGGGANGPGPAPAGGTGGGGSGGNPATPNGTNGTAYTGSGGGGQNTGGACSGAGGGGIIIIRYKFQ